MQRMMMVKGLFNGAHNGGDFNIGLYIPQDETGISH